MHPPRRAVVPIVRRHAPGFLSRLHLLEQIGMIALFAPKDIMTTMIMQGLNVGRIRTQALFGDDELEMRVVLTKLVNEAFGGITLTIIFLLTILYDNRFGHQRNHFTAIRMSNR